MHQKQAAPAALANNEIFLVQLTRAEIELALAHVGTVYVLKLAEATTPNAQVLQPDGEVVLLTDWIAKMGARSLSTSGREFVAAHGIEGLRTFSNKLLKLVGRSPL